MQNTSDASAAAAGLFLGAILVYAIVVLCIVAVGIWIYWRIFTKAGFNGALAFINLVPGFGSLICLLILAFGTWPIEEELAMLRAGRAPIPGPIPGPNIGGPPMPT